MIYKNINDEKLANFCLFAGDSIYRSIREFQKKEKKKLMETNLLQLF